MAVFVHLSGAGRSSADSVLTCPHCGGNDFETQLGTGKVCQSCGQVLVNGATGSSGNHRTRSASAAAPAVEQTMTYELDWEEDTWDAGKQFVWHRFPGSRGNAGTAAARAMANVRWRDARERRNDTFKGVESRIESISQVLCPGKAAQAIDIFASYRQAVPRIRVGNPNNAELIAVACVYCAMRMNRDNVATADDVTDRMSVDPASLTETVRRICRATSLPLPRLRLAAFTHQLILTYTRRFLLARQRVLFPHQTHQAASEKRDQERQKIAEAASGQDGGGDGGADLLLQFDTLDTFSVVDDTVNSRKKRKAARRLKRGTVDGEGHAEHEGDEGDGLVVPTSDLLDKEELDKWQRFEEMAEWVADLADKFCWATTRQTSTRRVQAASVITLVARHLLLLPVNTVPGHKDLQAAHDKRTDTCREACRWLGVAEVPLMNAGRRLATTLAALIRTLPDPSDQHQHHQVTRKNVHRYLSFLEPHKALIDTLTPDQLSLDETDTNGHRKAKRRKTEKGDVPSAAAGGEDDNGRGRGKGEGHCNGGGCETRAERARRKVERDEAVAAERKRKLDLWAKAVGCGGSDEDDTD